jgi:hypothetical protein
VIPGEDNNGSTAVVAPNGYVYCNHDMRVLSQIPKSGSNRPQYGISEVNTQGITIYYALPARPVTQGKTSITLQVYLLSVKEDAVNKHRATGLCPEL